MSEYGEVIGCGSHSCIINPPKGLGNNGPCRCADWRGQRYITQLTAERDEYKAALRDLWEWTGEEQPHFLNKCPTHREAIERATKDE